MGADCRLRQPRARPFLFSVMRHGRREGGEEGACVRAVNPMRGEEKRHGNQHSVRPSTRPSFRPSVRPSCVNARDHRFCHPDADAGFRPDRLTKLLLTRRAAVTSHRRVYGPISASASAIEEAAAAGRAVSALPISDTLRLTACSSLSLPLKHRADITFCRALFEARCVAQTTPRSEKLRIASKAFG